MKLMDQIRAAISESHVAIEKTDFSKAMLSDYIHPMDYARGIAQLWYVHNALELGIGKNTDLESFFTSEMVRTPTIVRDLSALGYRLDSMDALRETQTIVATLQSWSKDLPFALLGCIYILEGSRMGSLVIAKFLSKALGNAPGTFRGIEYHTEGAFATPMRVRNLKEQIERAELSQERADAVKLGAVEFMNLLNNLYNALPVTERQVASLSKAV